MTQLTSDSAQAALGMLAALHRGDLAGAEAMLGTFASEQERALSLSVVAELSLVLLAEATGTTFDDVTSRVSMSIASLR